MQQTQGEFIVSPVMKHTQGRFIVSPVMKHTLGPVLSLSCRTAYTGPVLNLSCHAAYTRLVLCLSCRTPYTGPVLSLSCHAAYTRSPEATISPVMQHLLGWCRVQIHEEGSAGLLSISSLHRSHANLLCIVPTQAYVPKDRCGTKRGKRGLIAM
eukprot:1161640-Pelagomonas_calceolata.AAC.11